MRKMVLISVAVLFVIGSAFSADAVMKRKGMGEHGGMAACDGDCSFNGSPLERLRTLGLDEKQMGAVQSIHFRTRKDMIRMKADVQVARVELREILSKDPVDLKAAEAAVKKIEGIQSEMKLTHIKVREEIKSNLTPEQRKKFVAMTGMGPMKKGEGMKCNCDRHGMDDMDEMGHGAHGRGKPPMQHNRN